MLVEPTVLAACIRSCRVSWRFLSPDTSGGLQEGSNHDGRLSLLSQDLTLLLALLSEANYCISLGSLRLPHCQNISFPSLYCLWPLMIAPRSMNICDQISATLNA